MTDSPASTPPELNAYLETWSGQWSQVLGQISGAPVPCAVLAESPNEMPPAGPGDLWVSCASSGGLRGEMCLRLGSASALRLAQIFMSEPPTPGTELTAEHGEALLELVRRVAGLVASDLKPRWGEVQLRLDPVEAAPSWPPASSCWIRIGDQSDAACVEMLCSAALVAGLRAEKGDASSPVAASESPDPLPGDGDVHRQLGLLRDVELAVTLCFGARQMLLREVLDLTPGAVVELDRQVSAPVDLLLDGRLLARGEVVVVGGNYGLRVTEIATTRH